MSASTPLAMTYSITTTFFADLDESGSE
jgi:hypothetical protein